MLHARFGLMALLPTLFLVTAVGGDLDSPIQSLRVRQEPKNEVSTNDKHADGKAVHSGWCKRSTPPLDATVIQKVKNNLEERGNLSWVSGIR